MIFDICQNLEYFSQDLESTDGALGEPLGQRLFKARVELLAELDKRLDRRYASPFTDIHAQGPDRVVAPNVVEQLVTALDGLELKAG